MAAVWKPDSVFTEQLPTGYARSKFLIDNRWDDLCAAYDASGITGRATNAILQGGM